MPLTINRLGSTLNISYKESDELFGQFLAKTPTKENSRLKEDTRLANDPKRQGSFLKQSDLMALEIIDFKRLNGIWANSGAAMETIFSYLAEGRASYAVYHVPNFYQAPLRDDCPSWKHSGGHVPIGRKLWNWFHWQFPDYKFHLQDEPDFAAFGRGHAIFGDIGQVSASTFQLTQRELRAGDMWISVLDAGLTHVIIDYHVDCLDF